MFSIIARVLSGVFQRVSSRPGWASRNWLHTPAQSGGVAVDMHVHDVDFVRYLLGEPDRIQAGGYRDSDGLIEQIFAIYNYGRDGIHKADYWFDYINKDYALSRWDTYEYEALVLLECDRIPVETARSIQDFAKAGRKVICKGHASEAPQADSPPPGTAPSRQAASGRISGRKP